MITEITILVLTLMLALSVYVIVRISKTVNDAKEQLKLEEKRRKKLQDILNEETRTSPKAVVGEIVKQDGREKEYGVFLDYGMSMALCKKFDTIDADGNSQHEYARNCAEELCDMINEGV